MANDHTCAVPLVADLSAFSFGCVFVAINHSPAVHMYLQTLLTLLERLMYGFELSQATRWLMIAFVPLNFSVQTILQIMHLEACLHEVHAMDDHPCTI